MMEKQPKWGASQHDKHWTELRKKLVMQRRAHEQRHKMARKYPGIREFARGHEMNDQVNNWDRQLHNVCEKLDIIERKTGQLGERSELDKEELRNVFPVVQRLLWTKWSNFQVFVHAFMRAGPTTKIFLNLAKPTKKQRCLLYFVYGAITLLGCCCMAFLEAPVDEEVEALDRAVWTLVGEVFTMPWLSHTLWVVVFADLAGRVVHEFFLRVFFSYTVPSNRPPTFGNEGRLAHLRYWHELAECGKMVCILIILLATAGTIAACAVMPQPRAAYVARCWLILEIWSLLLLPLTKAILTTLVLSMARGSGLFDGLLTIFPDVMDFLTVGVRTPEFLEWRIERMVEEAEVLRRVHREPPDIGGPVDPSRDDADGGNIAAYHQNPDTMPPALSQ